MAEAIAPLALYQARGDVVAGLPQSGGAQYLIIDTPRLDEDVSRCFRCGRCDLRSQECSFYVTLSFQGLYRRSKHLEPDARPGMPSAQNSAVSSTGVRFKRLMAETMFGNGSSLTPHYRSDMDARHLHCPCPPFLWNSTQIVANITHL